MIQNYIERMRGLQNNYLTTGTLAKAHDKIDPIF